MTLREGVLKSLVGHPPVEEWADWIVSRHNFCERNAGESLREIALVALRNVESCVALAPSPASGPTAKLRELVENMPHNRGRMFSTNKNKLGHDVCCYKCKLEAALAASVSPAGDGAATEKLREEIRNEIICDRATGAGDYSEAEEYANRIVGKAAPSDTQNPENKSGSGLLLDALSMAPDSVGSVAPTENGFTDFVERVRQHALAEGREPTAKQIGR